MITMVKLTYIVNDYDGDSGVITLLMTELLEYVINVLIMPHVTLLI